jgi:hypothetical protein
MKTITKNDYGMIGGFTLSAYASDLGLKPGEFPVAFSVQGFAGAFSLEYQTKDGSHVYWLTGTKYTFTIYND